MSNEEPMKRYSMRPEESRLGSTVEEEWLNPPTYEDPNAARGLAAVKADLARLVRNQPADAQLEKGLQFLNRREGLGLTAEGLEAIKQGVRAGQSPDEILDPLVASGAMTLPQKP